MPASALERWLIATLLAGAVLGITSARAAEPGEGRRARAAFLNVPLALRRPAGSLAGAVDASGGFTEPLSDDDESHQRVALSAALNAQALSWLDLGLLLDGRYDRHSDSDGGTDDGLLFQPELSVRGAFRLNGLGLGVELAAWAPAGANVGDSFSALSADGRVLVSHAGERLVVAGFGGYRLDRSAEASATAARLSFGDRTALGASDFDAALLGIGMGYAIGKSWLFAEATGRLLLGAPNVGASPVFVSVGGRHPLTASGSLSLEASLTALVSSRPDVAPLAELMPIEPRAVLALGLRYRTDSAESGKPRAPVRVAPPRPPARAAPAVAPASVELTLLDDRGQPLQHAKVTLVQGERETPLVESAPGRYGQRGVRPGPARVRIEADGFQTVERDLSVGAGAALQVDVQAQPALPAGQVRGLVRSRRGKPLTADVRIEPAGVAAKTDNDGFFQIDVPPGQYDVVIEAAGYQSQRRAVKVEKQGVVIVNADLGNAP